MRGIFDFDCMSVYYYCFFHGFIISAFLNAFHGETHYQSLYDKIRTLLCADHFLSRYFSKAKQTAAGQPLHRIFRASLHACGGAFYSVTCSQRKYHCSRLRILARSSAKAASQRGVSRSSLFSPLWDLSSRTRCTAQRRQNVSVCPIHFSSDRRSAKTHQPRCALTDRRFGFPLLLFRVASNTLASQAQQTIRPSGTAAPHITQRSSLVI